MLNDLSVAGGEGGPSHQIGFLGRLTPVVELAG